MVMVAKLQFFSDTSKYFHIFMKISLNLSLGDCLPYFPSRLVLSNKKPSSYFHSLDGFIFFLYSVLPCFYESSEIIFTPWLHRALCSLGIKAWDTYADELNQPCNRKASQVHHEWYRGRNNQDSWYQQTHQGHYSHFAHHAQPNQRYLFSGCHVSSHFLPCTVSVALCNVMYYSFWGQKYKFSLIPPNISIFLWK